MMSSISPSEEQRGSKAKKCWKSLYDERMSSLRTEGLSSGYDHPEITHADVNSTPCPRNDMSRKASSASPTRPMSDGITMGASSTTEMSSDEITVINPEIEAITKTTRDSKNNILLSIPSKFPGELIPIINPNQRIISIIPRVCKFIKKSTPLPELLNVELFASNIPADINLLKVKEALQKKTNLREELIKLGKYWAQYAYYLSLKDDYVWLDGRLVIPLPLQVPVETRVHSYHHGKRNMFEAARDV